MRFRVWCPAKINTFLSVGPPDASGYHPIRTEFQAVGWFDVLEIEPAETFQVDCDWEGLPAENTLTRAARLAQEIVNVPKMRVKLIKQIPEQAGLGGGSSDAGGLLRAIARSVGSSLDQHFMDIASSVGKDVPFFLVGGRARGEGYGDRLTPLPDLPQRWCVLAQPAERVSTVDAYRQLDAAPRLWRDWPGDSADEVYNDFERVAPCACGELIERLRVHGAVRAGLSGSGSAVFGFFEDQLSAERGLERLKAEWPNLWAAVAPTLSREESMRMEVSA